MKPTNPVRFEFIAMMALIMSITALSIDTLLPALGVIGDNFGVHSTSEKQLLVTMIFLGQGVGQLFAGALSDSLGRKPVMYVGFAIFIVASLLSVMTNSYEVLIASRFLQGLGTSAPRTTTTAIIRDSYSGNEMARIMSFTAMVFIFVPMVAPALGSVLLHFSGWQAIFYMQAVVALVAITWFALRQVETLPVEKRATLNIALFINSSRAFFKQKTAVIYTLASGFVSGAFFVFLSTAESILIGQYGKSSEFPYLFALVALAMAVSMFLNGKYVVKYGMRKMVGAASLLLTGVALLYVVLFAASDNPDLWIFMAFLMLQIFSVGFIFGNLMALMMEPLGHIAGMAAAISGFISTLIAVSYAGVIGRFIDMTALPLFVGFLISGLLLTGCLHWVKRGSLR